MPGSITDVAGVLLGHAHDFVRGSGVTVLRFPHGAAGAADIRGEAAGTRQMDSLLRPHPAGRMHALVFAGGSAFDSTPQGSCAIWRKPEWVSHPGASFPSFLPP
jgi:L-aminopeptidase/D-esterase-like protein